MPERELSDRDVMNKLSDMEKKYTGSETADDFKGYETLPEGDYVFGVENFKWTESKNANVGLNLTCIPIKPIGFDKAKVFHTFWITEDNMPYLKRDLEIICKKPLKNITILKKMDWMKAIFKAHVKDETYDNKTRSKIQWFIRMTEEDKNPDSGICMSSSDLSAMEPDDDDLPF